MRTFIAIKLPSEIKDEIINLQEELKKENKNVRWVKKENIHLTLKFIGEVEEKQIKKISEILLSITKQLNQFSVSISDVGAFPNLNNPRVIWVGIKKGKEKIINIMKKLNYELSTLGIPKENKDLSPHITIGRVKTGKVKIINKKFNEYEFNVNKIYLIQSELTSTGPLYTDKAEFTFSC